MDIFEKLKENVKMELRYSSGYPNCSEYDYAYECAMHDARKKMLKIIDQIEQEYRHHARKNYQDTQIL